jgi:hypothetical protein
LVWYTSFHILSCSDMELSEWVHFCSKFSLLLQSQSINSTPFWSTFKLMLHQTFLIETWYWLNLFYDTHIFSFLNFLMWVLLSKWLRYGQILLDGINEIIDVQIFSNWTNKPCFLLSLGFHLIKSLGVLNLPSLTCIIIIMNLDISQWSFPSIYDLSENAKI